MMHSGSSLKRGIIENIGGPDFEAAIARLRSHFSIDFVGVGDPQAADRIIASMILQYSFLPGDPSASMDAERDAP